MSADWLLLTVCGSGYDEVISLRAEAQAEGRRADREPSGQEPVALSETLSAAGSSCWADLISPTSPLIWYF